MRFGGCDKTQEMIDEWNKYTLALWAEEESKAPQEHSDYIVGDQTSLLF